MADAATTQEAPPQEQQPAPSVEVHPAELPEAAEQGGGQFRPMDFLLDTTLSVQVQLGQATLPVRQLLQMGPGSVLKLDKQVGQPLELFIRGVLFATGQLVVVNNQLAIRIKEILPVSAPGGTV